MVRRYYDSGGRFTGESRSTEDVRTPALWGILLIIALSFFPL